MASTRADFVFGDNISAHGRFFFTRGHFVALKFKARANPIDSRLRYAGRNGSKQLGALPVGNGVFLDMVRAFPASSARHASTVRILARFGQGFRGIFHGATEWESKSVFERPSSAH
jgi:hypothetical protein